MNDEKTAHKSPAKETVANFGVCLLHLRETEKIANPEAEVRPKINPPIDPIFLTPTAIIIKPIAARIMVNHTLKEIFSFKNRNPNKAVINGIAARQESVTAAEVFVIDHIKAIIAIARPIPPIIPDTPILR